MRCPGFNPSHSSLPLQANRWHPSKQTYTHSLFDGVDHVLFRLSNRVLDISECSRISDGVTDSNGMPLCQQPIIDHQLNIPVELGGHVRTLKKDIDFSTLKYSLAHQIVKMGVIVGYQWRVQIQTNTSADVSIKHP